MAETTHSTAKQCLILSESDCFCSLWNEIPLQIFNVFYASQKCLHFIKKKKKHHTFHGCWGYFTFLLPIFYQFLEQSRRFTLKLDSEVHDSVTGPN